MLLLVALALYIIPALLFILANIFAVLAFFDHDADTQVRGYLQSIALFVGSMAWGVIVSVLALIAGGASFASLILPFLQR